MTDKLSSPPNILRMTPNRTAQIYWTQPLLMWVKSALEYGFTVAEIASKIDVSKQTVHSTIRKHPALLDAWENSKEAAKSSDEKAIYTRNERMFVAAGRGKAEDVPVTTKASRRLPHWGPIGDLTSVPVGRRVAPLPVVRDCKK